MPRILTGDHKCSEHITGTVIDLPAGSYGPKHTLRIRARIEAFNRERYGMSPKQTAGWLARVQQLADVVATRPASTTVGGKKLLALPSVPLAPRLSSVLRECPNRADFVDPAFSGPAVRAPASGNTRGRAHPLKELNMRWDEEAAEQALRSEWVGARDLREDVPARVFDVVRCSDGEFFISLPYVGSAPSGTRLSVVGRSRNRLSLARSARSNVEGAASSFGGSEPTSADSGALPVPRRFPSIIDSVRVESQQSSGEWCELHMSLAKFDGSGQRSSCGSSPSLIRTPT